MSSTPQIYRQLQRRLDELPIGYPATESGVEIRILQHLFTPLEAEIAFHMSFLPEKAEKIHKRLKTRIPNLKTLKQHLNTMANKGSIVSHTTRGGYKVYSAAMLVIGMFEFQVDRLTKEFYQDFVDYLDEAFRDEVIKRKYPQLRPIPTEGRCQDFRAQIPGTFEVFCPGSGCSNNSSFN